MAKKHVFKAVSADTLEVVEFKVEVPDFDEFGELKDSVQTLACETIGDTKAVKEKSSLASDEYTKDQEKFINIAYVPQVIILLAVCILWDHSWGVYGETDKRIGVVASSIPCAICVLFCLICPHMPIFIKPDKKFTSDWFRYFMIFNILGLPCFALWASLSFLLAVHFYPNMEYLSSVILAVIVSFVLSCAIVLLLIFFIVRAKSYNVSRR